MVFLEEILWKQKASQHRTLRETSLRKVQEIVVQGVGSPTDQPCGVAEASPGGAADGSLEQR